MSVGYNMNISKVALTSNTKSAYLSCCRYVIRQKLEKWLERNRESILLISCLSASHIYCPCLMLSKCGIPKAVSMHCTFKFIV